VFGLALAGMFTALGGGIWFRGGSLSISIPKIEDEINETIPGLEFDSNELVEMAKKDEQVSELLEGKDYDVIVVIRRELFGENTAILVLKVEEKQYRITLDLNTETVKSVKEKGL
jgi:hypothetical protein